MNHTHKQPNHESTLVNRSVLALVIATISALFLGIIWPFLEAIFLAGLFAAVFHPLYRKILTFTNNACGISALLTLILVLCFVFVPITLIAITVIGQGAELASRASPWLQTVINDPAALDTLLQKLPFYDQLQTFGKGNLTSSMGEVIFAVTGTAVDFLQSATRLTVSAAVTFLLVLYSLFFFLMDGDRLVKLILYYLPLDNKNESLLLNRFRSVTIATLKGTAVIGFLQGSLAGFALWVCGVPNALFWSVAMMLLSVVPGVGAALVWIPASLHIASDGRWVEALGLFAYCAVLVGSIDNVLRPKLVGSDTQLHELMIFFSTLGGLIMFGLPGFIIGPIVAALFVTVWDIYGVEFRSWLPQTNFVAHSETHETILAQNTEELEELTELAAQVDDPPVQDAPKEDDGKTIDQDDKKNT